MKGWVKLHRQILNWEYYKDIPTKTLYFHLLLTVAFAQHTGRDGVVVPAGCVYTSIRKLADETGLTERQVRTALKCLEATHEVTQQTTHKGTLITLVKWAFLQGDTERATQQTTQQTTHSINKNNINNNIYYKKVVPIGQKKNGFCDYQQREYDYKKIEELSRKRLLGEKQKGELQE